MRTKKEQIYMVMLFHLKLCGWDYGRDAIVIRELRPMWNLIVAKGLVTPTEDFNYTHYEAIAKAAFEKAV